MSTTDLTTTGPDPDHTPVLDRRTGELVALELVDIDVLAAIEDDLAIRKADLGEDEALINGELLRRMDRRQLWTLRTPIADGGQWELKTASPTAGTTATDPAKLRAELLQLLAAGTVDAEAARAALRRSVSIVAYVDVNTDLAALEAKLERLQDIAGVTVYDVVISTNEHAPDAGVKRLQAAGHGDVVGRCQVTKPAPARKVKVTRKEAKR